MKQTNLYNTYDLHPDRTLPKPGDELLWSTIAAPDGDRYVIEEVIEEEHRIVFRCYHKTTGRSAIVHSTDNYVHFKR